MVADPRQPRDRERTAVDEAWEARVVVVVVVVVVEVEVGKWPGTGGGREGGKRLE